jgi:integrase/recombinase XerD
MGKRAAMTVFAPTIETFFTERLMTQRQASPRTIAAYRDTLRMLLVFAHQRTGKTPSRLDVADVDAALIGAFLTHLEQDRHNTARTRNTRLAAIHSLFRYAAFRHPEHARSIQLVLAIPSKRHDQKDVDYLQPAEVDALLAAPDRDTWIGRRDHALLVLMIQTGVRVGELTRLTWGDLQLGTGAHIHCIGKGRKERATPLTSQTVAILRVWRKEHTGETTDPLFPTRQGRALSADAVQWLVAKHAKTAAAACPSIAAKAVSPHVLRHSCAMNFLHAKVDIAVIALWLGHESTQTTQIYLHADMALKEQALARTTPPNTKPGRYRPPDELLAFLEGL